MIRIFDVVGDGTRLANARPFLTCDAEVARRLSLDTDGNLWCGWGTGEGLDGVVVFNPDGKRIGAISLPERCANLCFGGLSAQSPVHGGEPLALFAVGQHLGGAGRLRSAAKRRADPATLLARPE